MKVGMIERFADKFTREDLVRWTIGYFGLLGTIMQYGLGASRLF